MATLLARRSLVVSSLWLAMASCSSDAPVKEPDTSGQADAFGSGVEPLSPGPGSAGNLGGGAGSTPPNQPGGDGGSPGGGTAGSGGAGGTTPKADAGTPRTDASNASADAAPPPPPPANAMPGPACGKAMVPGPSGLQTITANGKDRTFIIAVPKAYDGKTPIPLLFGWHGAHGKASDNLYNLRRDLGDRTIVIYPNALEDPKLLYTTWMRDARDDLMFFDAMMVWLKTTVCFDTTRVFATGHSSGGFWSHTLGCQRGNVVRGIAPVSGGPREMVNCVGTVAAWVAHGNVDDQINIKTGIQGRDFWLKRNMCAATTMPTTPMPCVAYDGCAKGYPVQWCEFAGGHVWPPFATKGLWDFFSKL